MDLPNRDDDAFRKGLRSRVFWITAGLMIAMSVIVIRLWYLQIVQGEELKILSENNRLRQVSFPDFRGDIFDRNGRELASSRPAFEVLLTREDMDDPTAMLSRLKKLVRFSGKGVEKEFLAAPSFVPFTLARDISRDEAARIEEHRYELPGVSLSIQPIRVYPYGSFASHLLGYPGEISSAELRKSMYAGYRGGDRIGKYGIEKTCEPLLRGKRGEKIIEVDAAGRELNAITKIASKKGMSLNLSIDFATQMAAEKAIEGYSGAVVALKPSTGEILAMASAPDFDPNEFAVGIKPSYWRKLLNNRHHPLNNRAIQGLYSPGSTFKIIMAAAALEEGLVTKETKFNCPGSYRLGNKTFRCWKKVGHGPIAMERALEQSCDVYFYNLGLLLGVDKIAKWAGRFGLGKITGIALEHEKSGLIPTRAWKEKTYRERWMKGETLSVAIGQGFDLVTPLQMGLVIAAIANGGYMVQPKLLKLGEGEETNPESSGAQFFGLGPATIAVIRQGLLNAVNARHGTGHRAAIPGIQVAGKTGTVQVASSAKDESRAQEEMPEKLRDHAWFVGYAPFKHPEIAVAVLLEHAGHGGSAAAPVARQVMEAYLKNRHESRLEAKNIPR